uniref:Thioredoxin domain-containing protein n=1 Tax=Fagus sylvatica TaxID=28930 RepID=A0A2N9GLT4_FAGSY
MPLKMLDATVSNFDSVFEKFRSEAPKYKANLILFLADKDPSTSLSWCPVCNVFDILSSSLQDCVRAEPVIYKKLETGSDDVALLRAFVGDRPTWRNPQHPWRVDSRFKITGVPTLVRWENDTIQGRLEDHEAHLENKIDALVAGK